MSEEKVFPIEPLMDRVFVLKDDMSKDEKTGFHLPQTVKGRAQTGTVVAVGPGYLDTNTGQFHPMQLKVGDRVFLKEFDGYIIRYKDHEAFVFAEREILGKVIE
jgi:chaperonin GroES